MLRLASLGLSLLRHPLSWLAAALAVFFNQELFFGRVFSPADLLYTYQPWSSIRPAGWTHPLNYLRTDEVLIGLPRRLATARDLSAHGLGFWQQHTLVGTEATLSLHYLGALLWPPMWGFLVLPAAAANTFFHLPIPLVAGLSMWLLLRRLTPCRPAQALGAVMWALSGYLVVWLSAFSLPLVTGIVPALVWLGIEVADRPRRLSVAAYVLLLAWSFSPAYPPANVLDAAALTAFFAVYLPWRHRTGALQPALRLAGATVLGVAVAAALVLPQVHDFGAQAEAAGGFRYILGPLPRWAVALIAFPNLYGSPTAFDWRPPSDRYDLNYAEVMGYFGLTAAPAAVLGLVSGWLEGGREHRPWIAAAAAVAAVGLVLAFSPAALGLPLLGSVRPGRWLVLAAFAAVLLAVRGLDLATAAPRRAALLALLSAAAAVAAAAVLIGLDHWHRVGGQAGADSWFRIALLLVAAAAAGVVAVRPQEGAFALVLVVAVDLVSFGWSFNPAIPAADFYPAPAALAYLQANSVGYRVLVATPDGALWGGDVLNVYGIDSVTGYDHLRHRELVGALGPNLSQWDLDEWRVWGFLEVGSAVRYQDLLWNRLAVRYAYLPQGEAGVPSPAVAGWRRVYSGADGSIFENPQVLPEVFWVARGGAPAGLDHSRAAPDRDSVRVDGPGEVVWSTPADPGWSATVDGRPVSVDRYASFLVGVPVPAGAHRVEIAFAPAGGWIGYAVSASALALLGLLVLAWTWLASIASAGSRMPSSSQV